MTPGRISLWVAENGGSSASPRLNRVLRKASETRKVVRLVHEIFVEIQILPMKIYIYAIFAPDSSLQSLTEHGKLEPGIAPERPIPPERK